MVITRETLTKILVDAYMQTMNGLDRAILTKCVETVTKDFNIGWLNSIEMNIDDVLAEIISGYQIAVYDCYKELLLNKINVYQFNSWFY